MSRNIGNNQSGMAAILVTLIMMIVITLIVIGFVGITRRNQREALDRQLSTQAYDAAETGVNDAISAFTSSTPPRLTTYNSCAGAGSFISVANLHPSLSNTVSYSCILVNATPGDLYVSSVSSGQSQILNAQPMGGATGGFKVSWNATGRVGGVGNCHYPNGGGGHNFLPASGGGNTWQCPYGILRLDIFKYQPGVAGSGGLGSAVNMAQNTDSLYLVPSPGASSQYPSSGNLAFGGSQVYVVPTNCSVTGCSVELPFNDSSTDAYYFRLGAIYSDAHNVTLTPVNNVTFTGSQVVIDSTGKAQDELHRIQVRVPLTGTPTDMPNFGIQSTNDICKQLNVSGSTASGCPDS